MMRKMNKHYIDRAIDITRYLDGLYKTITSADNEISQDKKRIRQITIKCNKPNSNLSGGIILKINPTREDCDGATLIAFCDKDPQHLLMRKHLSI